MAENVLPTHETILQLIADAAPDHWSPRLFVENTGTDRRALDGRLDELRGADIVHLTPWQTGRGQGYELTDLGRNILSDKTLRAQFRAAIERGGRIDPRVADEDRYVPIDDSANARLEVLRSAYTPGPAPVTAGLIFACVAIFGIGAIVASQNGRSIARYLMGGDAETIRLMGALSPGKILEGEWWRLISASFVHFGLLHILFNMLTLRAVGRDLERTYGRWRYLTLYILSGLTGAVIVLVWAPTVGGRPILATGASACIWGLIGSQYATLVLNRDLFPPELYRAQKRQLNGLIFLNVLISLLPQISMVSHFAGGIAGVLLTIVLHHHRWSDFSRKFFAAIVLAAWPIFLLTLLGSAISADPRWQQIRARGDIVARVQSLKELREKIVPKIAAVEVELDRIDTAWQKSLDAKAEVPPEAAFAALRESIAVGQTIVGEASPDAAIEEIRTSARRYLGTLRSLGDHLEVVVLAGAPPNEVSRKQLREFRREVKAAREDWEKVRQIR